MKTRSIIMTALFLCLMTVVTGQETQSNWPKSIRTGNSKILVYQPQPDSLIGVMLYGRAAVSYSAGSANPVFGAIWFMTKIAVDRTSREVDLLSVKILNVRFPNQDESDPARIDQLKKTLETEVPRWNLNLTIDELNASLKETNAVSKQASNLSTAPPEIIFTIEPSVLVLFDGNPVFKPIPNSQVKKAINTPYLVLQDPSDRKYYLYGQAYWYSTLDVVNGQWEYVKDPPRDIKKIQQEMEAQAKKNQPQGQQPSQSQQKPQGQAMPQGQNQNMPQKTSPPQIIVRTKPAELLQSDGEPNFVPIEGTQLIYISNSENNIFMAIDRQMYFVLISGRWYTSRSLDGQWTFIASDQLPHDFARIPEGSPKDQVLASVAGTEAAQEALLDAQIPQTAAVDRKTANCKVTYDGDPKFVQIKGTLLYRATNTSSTVIMSGKTYYVCSNAVWFIGNTPMGPWAVATEIPPDIQNIPPEDPAYNVKYVYIYESTPEIVYVGYLPGYTGCYVFGPTVVYGTGFYYNPWYGTYYYPHPVTFGFSMNYNPWTGWGFSWGFSVGFMSFSFGVPHYGWWGPPVYRPPFPPPYTHYYGPRAPVVRNTNVNINVNNNYYNRNVYNNVNGVRPGSGGASGTPSRPGQPQAGTRPSGGQPSARPGQGGQQMPGGGAASQRPGGGANKADRVPGASNDVYTDRDGNVYRKDQNNNWQKNNGKDWQPIDLQSPQGGQSTKPGGQPSQPGGQQGGASPQRPSQPGGQQGGVSPQRPSQPGGQQGGVSPQRPSPQGGGSGGFDRSSMERQSQNRERGQQLNNNSSNFQRSSEGARPAGGGTSPRPAGGGGRR